jgi:transcriptional regulator GlxA family with amidase domain
LVAAQSAVMGSKESIKVIAFNLGFSSPESFSRWFHANAAYSPKVFRTMMQSPA